MLRSTQHCLSFWNLDLYAPLAERSEKLLIHKSKDLVTSLSLVILVNPAFEALLFAPLSDMSTEIKIISEVSAANGCDINIGRRLCYENPFQDRKVDLDPLPKSWVNVPKESYSETSKKM